MATLPAFSDPIAPLQTPFEQLSQAATDNLPDMLRACLKEEETERRDEVRRAWELRLFAKGVQQLYYDTKNYVYYALSPENVSFKLPTHRAVFDITSPHRRSFVSILSENPPGINFVPNDLARGTDVSAASAAEKQRSIVDRMVSMKQRQTRMSGLLCTDGVALAWTHLDRNGKLRVDLYGALERKVPLFSDDISDWDYCILSREANLWRAKYDNPNFADKIASTDTSSGNSQYERYARLSVVARKSGTADVLKSLVTEHWGFIRPWRYRKAPDNVRAEYERLFPNGMLLHAFGNTVVDAVEPDWGELAVEFPVDDEGQARPALLNGMPYIQRMYNDLRNQQRDAADYTPDRAVYHGGAVDGEAIEEQETAFGVAQIINPPNGMSVSDCMAVEPGVRMPTWEPLLQAIKQDGENLTGDFPSLYGGDTPGQDTVGVNRLLNNQAKGQLGPAWAAIQRLCAKVYQKAIVLSAQTMDADTVAVQGKNGQENFNPQAILEGQFFCHPDQDSSFPQTTADKRASFAQLSSEIASMGDVAVPILGAPDNLKLRVQLYGLPDFFIPGAEARDKALRQIEQCLSEPPVPMTNDPQWQQAHAAWRRDQLHMQLENSMGIGAMPGYPEPQPPMQCSVQIDPDWDYLQPMADKVQQWLSSPAAYDEERKDNQAGLQNVRLYGKSLRDAMAAQAAQQKPAREPMKISAAFKDLDPATQVQSLQNDGYQPDPDFYAAQKMQEAQGTAAETQETAAGAQHKAVLAAREAVAPALPGTPPSKSDKGRLK